MKYGPIINRWKRANPLMCHSLGIHDFDGKITILTPEFVKQRVSEIKADITELQSLGEPSEISDKYEYNLVLSTLKMELYELDVRRHYLVSPSPYISDWVNPFGIIETSYIMRNFAPINTRVQSIIDHESNFPAFVKQAIDNLQQAEMAKADISVNLDFLSGYISFYNDELISFVSQTDDNDLLEKWSVINSKAIEAMNDFKQFLQSKLPYASDNFALGETKFLEILEYTEGVKTSVDRLLEIGQNDLENNYNAMIELSKINYDGDPNQLVQDVMNDYPSPDKLLEYTRETLDRTREYLIRNEIVSIPTDSQCDVMYTPKSMRKFAFAAMNTPGPFEVEKASESYYWVTPPDPLWSKDKTADFMKLFSKPAFESITVHEAWPGHYLQLLYNNTTDSNIAKLFAYSYSMIEGWAHYTEEMMYEAGYEPFDRTRYRAGQLIEALIRNVRFICAVKMHCRGMTVEEARSMFMEKAFLSEVNANIEANRGTVDPMYLNYTLGKLMIKKLKEDYKKEKGKAFSLKIFHDELLSYGSPPISILRKIMLENSEGEYI